MFEKRKTTERGQAIVLIALAIIGLVSFTGLAVDAGIAFSNKRQAQNAADNAAFAAALSAIRNSEATENDLALAAENIMVKNGFDPDDGSVTVQVNNPPESGPYAGNDEYIQIIIETQAETFFAPVIGINETRSTVEAVVRAKTSEVSPLYNGSALVALKDTGDKTFIINGGNHVTVEGSGMFVNSSGSKALKIGGGTVIKTDTGIGVVGGTQIANSVEIDGYTVEWNANNPPVSTGLSQIPLPPDYSFIPMPPAPPSCAGLPTITKNSWNNYPDGTDVTISPGIYPNGITMLGGVTHVTMESGIYCVHDHFQFNGGMTVDGGNVKLVPQDNYDLVFNGGTILNFTNLEYYAEDGDLIIHGGNELHTDRFRFFVTGDANFRMHGGAVFVSNDTYFYLPEGKAEWNGGSIITMQAPPQNDPNGFGGLLMYKPWENTVDMDFHGGSDINLRGSFLLPHTELQFHGGNQLDAIQTQIVAYTLQFNGGSNIYVDFNDVDNYQAAAPPTIELAE